MINTSSRPQKEEDVKESVFWEGLVFIDAGSVQINVNMILRLLLLLLRLQLMIFQIITFP